MAKERSFERLGDDDLCKPPNSATRATRVRYQPAHIWSLIKRDKWLILRIVLVICKNRSLCGYVRDAELFQDHAGAGLVCTEN